LLESEQASNDKQASAPAIAHQIDLPSRENLGNLLPLSLAILSKTHEKEQFLLTRPASLAKLALRLFLASRSTAATLLLDDWRFSY
jgi:hypothetical protein